MRHQKLGPGFKFTKNLEADHDFENTDPNSGHISSSYGSFKVYRYIPSRCIPVYPFTLGITLSTTDCYWHITSNHNSPLSIYGTVPTVPVPPIHNSSWANCSQLWGHLWQSTRNLVSFWKIHYGTCPILGFSANTWLLSILDIHVRRTFYTRLTVGVLSAVHF